jgi:hypothetical protein
MLKTDSKEIIKIEALEDGGFKLSAKGKDGYLWEGNYYGLLSYESLQNLEGKMLTIVDASFQDKDQRKAVKDIVRRTIWFDWVENSLYRGKNPCPVGMPNTQ